MDLTGGPAGEPREVLRFALAMVGVARIKGTSVLSYDGPPETAWMIPLAIAEIASAFADRLDEAGGNSAQVMEDIYLAIAGGHTEGAGHG